MPEMGGVEVVERIRRREAASDRKRTAIIALAQWPEIAERFCPPVWTVTSPNR